jgi:hypothetical protein
MILPDEPRARTGPVDATPEAARAAEELVAPLLDAVRQLWIVAQVHVERARLERARARGARLGRLAARGACGLAAAAGVVFAVVGARGGLHALLGARPWLAELATGGLLIAVALVGTRLVRSAEDRAARRRLAARRGDTPPAPRPPRAPRAPRANGDGDVR